MKKIIKLLSFVVAFLITITSTSIVSTLALAKSEFGMDDIDKSCKSCLLYDNRSGTVVYEKEPNKKLPIASMTKLVSLGVIFDALDRGDISLSQEVLISENAASAEGSEAFLDANNRYSVEELLKTVIISSANDSTIALAEFVSGSEDNFVRKMNQLAGDLGMKNSHFTNSTGLPAVSHYSTARDMVKIYGKISNHEVYNKFSKIWIDELVHPSGRKTGLVNTNKLVKTYTSCVGGKTGHTNEAGYCLTASAKKNDMELIGVVIGGIDSKSRFNCMTELFDYGFNNFENRVIVKSSDPICNIEVKKSKEKVIELYPEVDYIKFLKKGDTYEYSTEIELFEVQAPLKSDQRLGVLMILDKNNIVIDEINLVSKRDIEKIKISEILDKIYFEW